MKPLIAVTGHGQAMQGYELMEGLNRLTREFDKIAIPEHGKYVDGTR